jgi:hypothetical protein
VFTLRRLVEHGRLGLRVVLQQLHVGQHCGTEGSPGILSWEHSP